MIEFTVEDRQGNIRHIKVPADISLSLMEVLKASEYDILATCGGMALCATCHVAVESGLDKLDEPSGSEMDMLDTLPVATAGSRLACQIMIGEHLNGAHFILMGEEG